MAMESPYFENPIRILFENNVKAHIHPHVLAKSPALVARRNLYTSVIDAQCISPEVGHVLINFLYVGVYERFGPRVECSDQDVVAHLTTAIGVYLSTPTHGITALEILAKGEIERLGDMLPLTVLFDVVEDTYPIPNEADFWFPAFLTRRLQAFTSNLTREKVTKTLDHLKEARTLSKILLKNIVEYHQRTMDDAAERRPDNNGTLEITSAEEKDDEPAEEQLPDSLLAKTDSEAFLKPEKFAQAEGASDVPRGGVKLAEVEGVQKPPETVNSSLLNGQNGLNPIPEPATSSSTILGQKDPLEPPADEEVPPKVLSKKEKKKMIRKMRAAENTSPNQPDA